MSLKHSNIQNTQHKVIGNGLITSIQLSREEYLQHAL